MAEMKGWQRLTCECGGDTFSRVLHLKWSPNGGTVEEPAFYKCDHCLGLVDQMMLVKRAQLLAAKREVDEKQGELDAVEAGMPKRGPGRPPKPKEADADALA